jgi:hypothetical protein
MAKYGVKIGNIKDLGHKYEKGTLYYFKGNGDIYKSPMAVGGKTPKKITPMDERREMNGTSKPKKPKKTTKKSKLK